jgi:hypothetical protein
LWTKTGQEKQKKEIINPVRCRYRFWIGHHLPHCHHHYRRWDHFRLVEVKAGIVAEGNDLS